MKYKLLGRSGLRVSEIALGAMTFGEEWGFGNDFEGVERLFSAYDERGGNFIDTANKYTNGTSEEFCGRLVAGRRGRFVIATKYTLSMDDDDINASGNHRKNLVQAVEASLRRLGTDYIDVLWVHAWDYTTPIDEMMRGLDDLVRLGKVLYVGVSDAPAWVVSSANTMADLRGWTPFIGLQIEYSLIERTVERELMPMSEQFGLSVAAWAPLGGGVLTGKYTRGSTDDSLRMTMNERRRTERNLAIAKEVDAVADELGQSSTRVALNWVRQQSRHIVPIVGARKVEQLEDSLGCLDFELAPEHLSRLDRASAIEYGFPQSFLAEERVRTVVGGHHHDRLDRSNHGPDPRRWARG